MWKEDSISIFLKCISTHPYFLQIIHFGQNPTEYIKQDPFLFKAQPLEG